MFGVASATFIQFLKKISLSVLDVLLSSKPSLLISFETEEKEVTINNISKIFFICRVPDFGLFLHKERFGRQKSSESVLICRTRRLHAGLNITVLARTASGGLSAFLRLQPQKSTSYPQKTARNRSGEFYGGE